MVDFEYKPNYQFEDLLKIMNILRSECPWDREQTHESIRANLLEEAYEACEAIDLNNSDMLREELGDVLLQVIFHSVIAGESGGFSIDDVCDTVSKKLIGRHPHIFGEAVANSADDVLEVWDKIKKAEKGQNSYTDSVTAVAKSLPSLTRADKVQGRAAKSGFDFSNAEDAWKKVLEEADEFIGAEPDCEEEELGDLLFAVVNVARLKKIDSERALEKATEKFIRRFAFVEREGGENLENMSLEQMDKLWDLAKQSGI